VTEARTPTLAEVVAAVHRRYDPAWAEPWDAVGLVCGDPEAPVRRILLAVDPVAATAQEALDLGADLLLTHHPLLLRPVSSVAATTPAGRLLHRLIRGGVALLAAHTNADSAPGGVSDALAAVTGLVEVEPLVPAPSGAGLGRVGDLDAAVTLGALADRVAAGVPATAQGVRVAGDLGREVRRIAVCGGAGSDLIGAARAAGADVLVTADLKHHQVLDARELGDLALVDLAHWASEWPWLPTAADRLVADLAADGATVEVHVSDRVTDPWTARR
jgi:dinuclear metal center YbgI/SA1388 family protein